MWLTRNNVLKPAARNVLTKSPSPQSVDFCSLAMVQILNPANDRVIHSSTQFNTRDCHEKGRKCILKISNNVEHRPMEHEWMGSKGWRAMACA
jgi:hypothetical protein